MANKSNPATQTLSTPQGGGALHGIGETFSPDLHTGTGNFTVPIALPQGRNGFQPQLNLVYSTGNGNGPFGLGWSLSIPGVSRKTSRGIPRYADDHDTFLLSGAEDWCPLRRRQARRVIVCERKAFSLASNIAAIRRRITGRFAARMGWSACTGHRAASRTIRRSSPIRRIEIRSSTGSSPKPKILQRIEEF